MLPNRLIPLQPGPTLKRFSRSAETGRIARPDFARVGTYGIGSSPERPLDGLVPYAHQGARPATCSSLTLARSFASGPLRITSAERAAACYPRCRSGKGCLLRPFCWWCRCGHTTTTSPRDCLTRWVITPPPRCRETRNSGSPVARQLPPVNSAPRDVFCHHDVRGKLGSQKASLRPSLMRTSMTSLFSSSHLINRYPDASQVPCKGLSAMVEVFPWPVK